MAMTLTEIENLSPVEIEYHHSVRGEGQYDYGSKCIIIDKDLEYNAKIECLLHEIGHAMHDINGCQCMNCSNHMLAEYHAMKFAMKYVRNNPALARVFIDKIIFELQRSFDSEHKTAAKRIVKLKQWEKLCKAI